MNILHKNHFFRPTVGNSSSLEYFQVGQHL